MKEYLIKMNKLPGAYLEMLDRDLALFQTQQKIEIEERAEKFSTDRNLALKLSQGLTRTMAKAKGIRTPNISKGLDAVYEISKTVGWVHYEIKKKETKKGFYDVVVILKLSNFYFLLSDLIQKRKGSIPEKLLKNVIPSPKKWGKNLEKKLKEDYKAKKITVDLVGGVE